MLLAEGHLSCQTQPCVNLGRTTFSQAHLRFRCVRATPLRDSAHHAVVVTLPTTQVVIAPRERRAIRPPDVLPARAAWLRADPS